MIEYTVKVNEAGDTFWYLNGELYRENDLPSVVRANGAREWYLNGKLHRENGPAIEDSDPDGSEEWFKHGLLHREDGPAVEYASGNKYWFLNDEGYSEKEFNEKMNPTKELTIAEIEKLLGHKVKVVK